MQLKLRTNNKYLGKYFEDVNDILKEITYDFIFDLSNWKEMKMSESDRRSSYRTMKLFGIAESALKDIIAEKQELVPFETQAIFNKERHPLNFKTLSNLENSSKGFISKKELKAKISLNNVNGFDIAWNQILNPSYMKRNWIVHSYKEEHSEPRDFVISLIYLGAIIYFQIKNTKVKKLRSISRDEKSIILDIDKDIFEDFLENMIKPIKSLSIIQMIE